MRIVAKEVSSIPKRVSEQERREKALMGTIAKHAAEMGLYEGKDIAAFLGMSPQSYGQYRKKKFQTPGFILFCFIARKFQMSGREVCAAVGVPYADTAE